MAVTTRYSRPSTPALCEGGRAEDSKSQHPCTSLPLLTICSFHLAPTHQSKPIPTHLAAVQSNTFLAHRRGSLTFPFCLRLLSPRRQAKNALHYLPFLTMSSDIGQRPDQVGNSDQNANVVSASPNIVFSPLQAVEEPEKLIAGVITGRSAVRRCCLGESLLLHRQRRL